MLEGAVSSPRELHFSRLNNPNFLGHQTSLKTPRAFYLHFFKETRLGQPSRVGARYLPPSMRILCPPTPSFPRPSFCSPARLPQFHGPGVARPCPAPHAPPRLPHRPRLPPRRSPAAPAPGRRERRGCFRGSGPAPIGPRGGFEQQRQQQSPGPACPASAAQPGPLLPARPYPDSPAEHSPACPGPVCSALPQRFGTALRGRQRGPGGQQPGALGGNGNANCGSGR